MKKKFFKNPKTNAFLTVFLILIIFFILEIFTRITLGFFGYPTTYKLGNIGVNNYDYLTGYYNKPNKESFFKTSTSKIKGRIGFNQGTDRYGFHIDGKRKSDKDLSKKKNCIYRIFLVGGSTVIGKDLKDFNDPLSARIEKILDDSFKDFNIFFEVINTGATSFFSGQELLLLQNRILFNLKSNHIIVLNGTNDYLVPLGENQFYSNSHYYQRQFQRNFLKSQNNVINLFDSFLSRNVSIYFLFKKIIEKSTSVTFFDQDKRDFYENSNLDLIEVKKKRYFYNLKMIGNLSRSDLPINIFFQPQMLPDNKDNLVEIDKSFFNLFDKKNGEYFKGKQHFYNIVRNEIKNMKEQNNLGYHIDDISNILDDNKNEVNFYSDHVHYTNHSRKIISKNIFENIKVNVKTNILNNFKNCF